MLTPPRSPLDDIPDLQEVDPQKIQALEERLLRTYIPKVEAQVREARQRAEALRSIALD